MEGLFDYFALKGPLPSSVTSAQYSIEHAPKTVNNLAKQYSPQAESKMYNQATCNGLYNIYQNSSKYYSPFNFSFVQF